MGVKAVEELGQPDQPRLHMFKIEFARSRCTLHTGSVNSLNVRMKIAPVDVAIWLDGFLRGLEAWVEMGMVVLLDCLEVRICV